MWGRVGGGDLQISISLKDFERLYFYRIILILMQFVTIIVKVSSHVLLFYNLSLIPFYLIISFINSSPGTNITEPAKSFDYYYNGGEKEEEDVQNTILVGNFIM